MEISLWMDTLVPWNVVVVDQMLLQRFGEGGELWVEVEGLVEKLGGEGNWGLV